MQNEAKKDIFITLFGKIEVTSRLDFKTQSSPFAGSLPCWWIVKYKIESRMEPKDQARGTLQTKKHISQKMGEMVRKMSNIIVWWSAPKSIMLNLGASWVATIKFFYTDIRPILKYICNLSGVPLILICTPVVLTTLVFKCQLWINL